MLKYGMRGHDIAVCQPMESAFSKMESLGITRIQLAMDKTISDFDFSVGSYTQEKAERIRESLFRHHIELPVLSCYINPADPNEGQRNQAVARFIETMRYAKVLGAGLVGTETGRAASDMSITPLTESEDCYQRMLRSFSKIAEEAERLNVRVGVEGVFSHTLSTPEKMDRFLREIGSRAFFVILDAANLIRPSLAGDTALHRCLDAEGGPARRGHHGLLRADAAGLQERERLPCDSRGVHPRTLPRRLPFL